jgi:glycerol-3-phosphate acyltransferase PlsY
MGFLHIASLLVVSYFIGATPNGWMVVKLKTGKDIREVESGRTGGTNAARAGGMSAGAVTGILDFFKGAIPVWLALWAGHQYDWVAIACPLLAILGHNYSIFLAERDANGRLQLKGGAGGATCMGGAFALWPPSLLIIGPVSMGILFGLGYASVATMSMAFSAIIIFAVRALLGVSPPIYVLYGVFAELLLMWALRPNIKRLAQGTERVLEVSLHAKLRKRTRQQHHA